VPLTGRYPAIRNNRVIAAQVPAILKFLWLKNSTMQIVLEMAKGMSKVTMGRRYRLLVKNDDQCQGINGEETGNSAGFPITGNIMKHADHGQRENQPETEEGQTERFDKFAHKIDTIVVTGLKPVDHDERLCHNFHRKSPGL